MFVEMTIFFLLIVWFSLWGWFMKLLVFLEIASVLLIYQVFLAALSLNLSMGFALITLVYLVAESSLGFVLYIYYITYSLNLMKKEVMMQY